MPRSAVDAIWRERRLLAMRAEVEASNGEHPSHTHARRGYDPNQPRVPKGNPDGGRWTSDGRGAGIQVAAEKPPPLGGTWIAKLLRELAMIAIKLHRKEGSLYDLFGKAHGTVTYIKIDGEDIFGSNSTLPMYTKADYDEAVRLRDALIKKYPDLLKQDNIGEKPNDAFFHGETNVLLRARTKLGGTLAGRTIHVYVDRAMCPSCIKVLPKIGLELGNPTVTFEDYAGRTHTMKDGEWMQ
jgi:hypothetical protein